MTATLTELLHESASTWPERVAVSDITGGQAITYTELGALVDDLAAELNRNGIRRGDSVAIVSDTCIEYVLALFAVVAVGACAAPLNPQLAARQLVSRLGQVRARAAIVPAHLSDDFAGTHAAVTLPVWKLALMPGQDRGFHARFAGAPLCGDGCGCAQAGAATTGTGTASGLSRRSRPRLTSPAARSGISPRPSGSWAGGQPGLPSRRGPPTYCRRPQRHRLLWCLVPLQFPCSRR